MTNRRLGGGRVRFAVRGIFVAVAVAVATQVSPAAAGKPPHPAVDVRVTVTAPTTVTVGQAFTVTGTATDIYSRASLCPAAAESRSSVSSTVSTDVITMNADGCSATVTATTAGAREITFYFAKPYQKGQAAFARVTASEPSPPPPGPNDFDPNFSLRSGRYDCYLGATFFAFTVDVIDRTNYSVPTLTTGPFGSGPTGTWTMNVVTGDITWVTGPMSTGFLGTTATRADVITKVVFTVRSPSGTLNCFARTTP
jgi:hypothetical protein